MENKCDISTIVSEFRFFQKAIQRVDLKKNIYKMRGDRYG